MRNYSTITEIADQNGDETKLRLLHHAAGTYTGGEVLEAAQLEVQLDSRGTWDAADPAQRAALQQLVEGLLTVIAQGASVQAIGSP